MTVESFLFRVDRLKELYGPSRQQVFREFHLLLEGAATKWYWQLMEDKAEVYDFDYYSLTQKIRRAFSTTGRDFMKSRSKWNASKGRTKPLAIMFRICTTSISSSSTKSLKMN